MTPIYTDSTNQEYKNKYKWAYLIMFIGGFIIVSRLFYLQIIIGKELRAFSDKNRIKKHIIASPRGIIFDRKGRILAENKFIYSVSISPQYTKDLKKTAHLISPIINKPAEKIIKMVSTSRFSNGQFLPVVIKQNISLDEIFKIKKLRLRTTGIYIDSSIIRHYPLKKMGAHLLGYVGEISRKQIKMYKKRNLHLKNGDIIGKAGIELSWNKELIGTDGIKLIEVDARGRKTTDSKHKFLDDLDEEPIPGHNLVLTIDSELQKITYKAMKRNDKYGHRTGAALAMKTNGEILSWVSAPSFDPNDFSLGMSIQVWRKLIKDSFSPLRNKAVQDPAAPGSTLKPFVALAALQEEVITAKEKVKSPGKIRYRNRTYHDSHKEGHGRINVIQAIERSSNVFFYKVGIGLGIDRLAQYLKLFGLGKKTGIKIPSEKSGIIPTRKWKEEQLGRKWQLGETLSNTIGQGFMLTTLLQLAKAYNTIALDGEVYKPFIVKKILDGHQKILTEFKPKLEKNISDPKEKVFIKEEHFRTVREGLENVFHGKNGTARWLRIPRMRAAGKTGTSQVRSFTSETLYTECIKWPVKNRHHAWFVGYAPAIKPEIVVAIFAERGCSGPGGAAPVFKDIVTKYFEQKRNKK